MLGNGCPIKKCVGMTCSATKRSITFLFDDSALHLDGIKSNGEMDILYIGFKELDNGSHTYYFKGSDTLGKVIRNRFGRLSCDSTNFFKEIENTVGITVKLGKNYSRRFMKWLVSIHIQLGLIQL